MDALASLETVFAVAQFLSDSEILQVAHCNYCTRIIFSFFVNEIRGAYIDAIPHSTRSEHGRPIIRASFEPRR